MKQLTRREFGAALAVLGVSSNSWSSCATSLPSWATQLEADLDKMATRLRAQLKPWKGPTRVARPEDFGYASGQPLATQSIQAAIESLAQQGGGTVVLSRGDYVSGTLDLRSHIRLQVNKGARLLASLDLKDYPQRV